MKDLENLCLISSSPWPSISQKEKGLLLLIGSIISDTVMFCHVD